MTSTAPPTYNQKDFETPITDAFVKTFADDKLVLDCPHITLRQQAISNPRAIHGRGMIFLLQRERFQLRMYVDSDVDSGFTHPLNAMSNWVSGEIIPPEEYFDLEAIDVSGYAWMCKKLQIKTHGRNHGIVVTGELFDVLVHRASGLTPTLPTLMSIFFFKELKVPFTHFVETHSGAGEQMLSLRLRPEFAQFDAGEFRFKVRHTESEKGSTILSVSSSGDSFPEGIETRVEESLCYVTFSPIAWCIVDKRHRGTREVIVVPCRQTKNALFYEPLDHQRSECAEDYWRLFAAYFQHVASFNEASNYHPLSAQLFHVISSETQQLDLMGLLVSVAVEGVLNCEFKDIAKPSDAFKANLDRISKIIGRLKCVDENLAKRLQGSLPKMKSSSAKDKLKLLEEIGVITTDMVKAWEKLRNTTAHASVRFDPTETQTIWNKCNAVYTMLNLLVFQAIGYSGQYQDFSSREWPMKRYEKKLPPDS